MVGSVVAAALLFGIGCSRRVPEDKAPPIDTVQGPAGALHVDDGGEGGLPVVFVHSFGGDSSHWREQLAHLRPTRRAIALDLRAHGKSAAPATEDYSVGDFASDIAAVVNELGLERFVLVGHSLGGAAALDYAASHPDKVAGLVLVSAPGRMPPDQAQQILTSLETDYDAVTQSYWDKLLANAKPEVRTQVQTGMTSVSKPVSFAIIRSLMQADPVPSVEKFTGPKLAIVTPPSDDPLALHNQAPGLPHVEIGGTSHWIHLDKPEEFDRTLDDFLARLPA